MRIAESCTESVHVVHASNMCAAWRCRLDTSGIDLSQVEGGGKPVTALAYRLQLGLLLLRNSRPLLSPKSVRQRKLPPVTAQSGADHAIN